MHFSQAEIDRVSMLKHSLFTATLECCWDIGEPHTGHGQKAHHLALLSSIHARYFYFTSISDMYNPKLYLLNPLFMTFSPDLPPLANPFPTRPTPSLCSLPSCPPILRKTRHVSLLQECDSLSIVRCLVPRISMLLRRLHANYVPYQ